MIDQQNTTSDDDLFDALRAELGERPPSIDLDRVVAGARRRRVARRARIGAAGLGMAATVAGLAFVSVMMTPAGEYLSVAQEPPAPMSGCTLEPTTCDSAVVDDWAQDNLVGGGVQIRLLPFVDPEYDEGGTTVGQQSVTIDVFGPRSGATKKSTKALGDIEVGVADHVDADVLVSLMHGEGDITQDRTATFTVAGEPVEVRILQINRGNAPDETTLDELWIVPEGPTHGAVIMSASGNEPGSNLAPPDDSGPGWTDATAKDLITRLLTEPPKAG